MLFFYIRHGAPIYQPDQLLPLGERQAEAVGKRLAMYGLDKIFSSTSTRAIQTAKPACEMTRLELTQLAFAHEHTAWEELSIDNGDGKGRHWIFTDAAIRQLFTEPEMRALGDRWYEHPTLAEHHFERGMERIRTESDKFFASLGYEHIPYTGKYRAVAPNNDRVALFAHQGFGLAFLSCLLDIPYPQFSTHFDLCHTGMTVIDFSDEGGYAIPRVCMLSADGHLYREGLPTYYNNRMRF